MQCNTYGERTTTLIVPSVCPLINCVIKANEGRMGGKGLGKCDWYHMVSDRCIATLARPRQPTRRDAMRARCVAARLIDDSGRNAKSATWRPQIDVRCPIHCSDGTIEREHCRTAFLCVELRCQTSENVVLRSQTKRMK